MDFDSDAYLRDNPEPIKPNKVEEFDSDAYLRDNPPVANEEKTYSSLGAIGKYIPDFLNPMAKSEEEIAEIKSLSPLEAAKRAGSDALSTASIALPGFGAGVQGVKGVAARALGQAGIGAGLDVVDSLANDRPTEDIAPHALKVGAISGGLSAGLESAIKAGELVYKGGKWVKNQAARALTKHQIPDEVLAKPEVQEAISNATGLGSSLGIGKSFKAKMGEQADEAANTAEQAIKNLPQNPIPVADVVPEEALRTLDIPNRPDLRPKLESHKKSIRTSLEPPTFRAMREAEDLANQQALQARRNELQAALEQKRTAKLKPFADEMEADLIMAKQADAITPVGSSYTRRIEEAEKLPESLEKGQLIARLKRQEDLAKARGVLSPETVPESHLNSLVDEYRPISDKMEADVAEQLAPDIEALQSLPKSLPASEPMTTVQDAYRVANMPIAKDVNIIGDVINPNITHLAPEGIAAANEARQRMSTLQEVADSSINPDTGLERTLKWGARAAGAAFLPKALSAELVTNPELRHILGSKAENLGKWGEKLLTSFRNKGATGLTATVAVLNQIDPEFRKAHSESLSVSPYTEPKETKPTRPELTDEQFYKGLGNVESNGKYGATNPNSSATGKYQFLWDTHKDMINKWYGGNVPREAFLASPKAQERVMRKYDKEVLTPKAIEIKQSIPNAASRSISEIKALIHFKGVGGARKYLLSGVDDTRENNMDVESYLKKVYGE